jgi:hypothetical protein
VPLLNNPDVIFIALGTNDSNNMVEIGEIDYEAPSYDLHKFAPAYVKGMKDAIAAYPNAKIICVAFDMLQPYQDTIKQIAEHYGCQYMYVGDISVVHPNKAEMSACSQRIVGSLEFKLKDELGYIKKQINTINVENLPVSNGDDISVGKAYIESSTGYVKVKQI